MVKFFGDAWGISVVTWRRNIGMMIFQSFNLGESAVSVLCFIGRIGYPPPCERYSGCSRRDIELCLRALNLIKPNIRRKTYLPDELSWRSAAARIHCPMRWHKKLRSFLPVDLWLRWIHDDRQVMDKQDPNRTHWLNC